MPRTNLSLPKRILAQRSDRRAGDDTDCAQPDDDEDQLAHAGTEVGMTSFAGEVASFGNSAAWTAWNSKMGCER